MTKTIGVFGDEPNLGTGFATVCSNLAYYLSNYSDLRVIYFGRYGQKIGFSPQSSTYDFPFEYVPCEGGTWNRDLIAAITSHYKLDALFSEDDWWSTQGFMDVSQLMKKPFHLLAAIDSLPIHPLGYKMMSQASKVYVPNRSYKIMNEHYKSNKVEFLPHGVNTMIFRPLPLKNDIFTFVWIGRDEDRKALGRTILAFEQIQNKYDTQLLIRTNWSMPDAIQTAQYIEKKKLKVIPQNMERCPYNQLAKVYNQGHVLVCSSKAGAFELQVPEAMACELPALVTDWNFMNQHIEHGINGFLVPCEEFVTVSWNRIWGNIDINLLAQYMKWCLEHQKEIADMGRYARFFVQEKYSWKEITKTLYSGILSTLGEDNVQTT